MVMWERMHAYMYYYTSIIDCSVYITQYGIYCSHHTHTIAHTYTHHTHTHCHTVCGRCLACARINAVIRSTKISTLVCMLCENNYGTLDRQSRTAIYILHIACSNCSWIAMRHWLISHQTTANTVVNAFMDSI